MEGSRRRRRGKECSGDELNCRSGDGSGGGGSSAGRNLWLEKLPPEVSSRVFSLLDHRGLAAALQVCTAWKRMASEDSLWKKLFAERWGAAGAKFYAPPIDGAKSWKDVYEVQDRCDRVGMSLKIVREGREYYLVYQGQIHRLLGSRVADDEEEADGGATDSPPPSLSEKMLFFLGDLETACAMTRRSQ